MSTPPPTSLARAAAAAASVSSPASAASEEEGKDVLSPLPPTSSLARAAAAAVSKSGSMLSNNNKSSNNKKKKASHVRVVARIRPLSDAEISRGYSESVVPIEVDCHDDNNNAAAAIIPFANASSPSSPTNNVMSITNNNNSTFKTPKIGNTSRTNSATLEEEVTVLPKTVSLTAGTDPAKAKQFDYDCVFPSDTSQTAVYDLSVGEAVKRNIFRGFNTTIIAYGQTGSGKTYTMDGPCPTQEVIAEDEEMLSPSARPFVSPKKHRNLSPKRNVGGKNGRARTSGIPRRQSSLNSSGGQFLSEYDGIIPRAIHDLFETKNKEQREAKIHLSYLEIYNDSIRDLLGSDDASSENLQLRDDGHGISIKGLSSMEVKSAMDAKELMDVAAVRRTTGVCTF